MKKYCGVLVFIFVLSDLLAQVQSPAEFLGYELGSRFTRHHQVVSYYEHLDAESEELSLQKYGATYEQRLLQVAFISTPENLKNLEQIRLDNLRRAGLASGTPQTNVSIVWLSYNVHGNESVSTEASMMTAYELLRPGSNKKEWLKNTVVVIDPCVNPDGRDRYVNFYWERGNFPYNPDPNSWEHQEGWPSGRPNHYMFDLNRDWAWLTQVESQQRMKLYNQWLPHVHVDFHEQGVNEPYYFAPAAEPFHELITPWQRDFQTQIGKNNARYFDANHWLYFTKQRFDLLYPSYGDTYPTYSGAIGMTYEQGGSGRAGLGVITQEGDTLTLLDRILHHHTTGLSTIEITAKNAGRVISEFERFYANPPATTFKTYVLKHDDNEDKMTALRQWLDAHGIRYGTTAEKSLTGYQYSSGQTKGFAIGKNDLVVSVNQPKSVLTTVLFEPKTRLTDSLTYDITAWAVPYAFGLEAYATTVSLPVNDLATHTFQPNSHEDGYGYIFKWSHMKDAAFLSALLNAGVKVRYTMYPLTAGNNTFAPGSLIVTRTDNPDAQLYRKVTELANAHERKAWPLSSGMVAAGPDIGSSDIGWIRAPKVAVLGGNGASSSLDFGAVWHFMEQELGYPVTTLSSAYFGGVNLSGYDVLILPDGWYGELDKEAWAKMDEWVRAGGTLVAMQGAVSKLMNNDLTGLKKYNNDQEKSAFEALEKEKQEQLRNLPFTERERFELKDYVAGAIFKVKMDNTHPLAYGYGSTYYTLKTDADRYALLDEQNVGFIDSTQDHLSGFAGANVRAKTGQSLVFGVEDKGRGRVIYMVDNPLFRSFWQNGKLLFANALFFNP